MKFKYLFLLIFFTCITEIANSEDHQILMESYSIRKKNALREKFKNQYQWCQDSDSKILGKKVELMHTTSQTKEVSISWQGSEFKQCKNSYGIWNCGNRSFRTYPVFYQVLDNSASWWKIDWVANNTKKDHQYVTCKQISQHEFHETINKLYNGYIPESDNPTSVMAVKRVIYKKKYRILSPNF